MPEELLRSARPEESRDLAWAVLEAARGHTGRGTWDLLLEQADDAERLDLIESLVLADASSPCHYSGFHVLEVAGEPVTWLAAYDPGSEGYVPLGAVIAEAFDELGYSRDALTAAFQRLADYDACAPDSQPGTWILEWVATRPEHRGRGLAARLLARALELGRDRGLARAQISIAVGNDAARRSYERLGFRTDRDRRHPAFERALGAPGMLQMGMELRPTKG